LDAFPLAKTTKSMSPSKMKTVWVSDFMLSQPRIKDSWLSRKHMVQLHQECFVS
jgi:hypothetical protein